MDDVISVVDVDERHIQASPSGMRQHAPWLHSMVRLMATGETADEVLAQLLDAQEMQRLVRPDLGEVADLGSAALEPSLAR